MEARNDMVRRQTVERRRNNRKFESERKLDQRIEWPKRADSQVRSTVRVVRNSTWHRGKPRDQHPPNRRYRPQWSPNPHRSWKNQRNNFQRSGRGKPRKDTNRQRNRRDPQGYNREKNALVNKEKEQIQAPAPVAFPTTHITQLVLPGISSLQSLLAPPATPAFNVQPSMSPSASATAALLGAVGQLFMMQKAGQTQSRPAALF